MNRLAAETSAAVRDAVAERLGEAGIPQVAIAYVEIIRSRATVGPIRGRIRTDGTADVRIIERLVEHQSAGRNRQCGDGTGHAAERIGNDDRIVSGVSALHVDARKSVCRRA